MLKRIASDFALFYSIRLPAAVTRIVCSLPARRELHDQAVLFALVVAIPLILWGQP